jgi:hypothetical protein
MGYDVDEIDEQTARDRPCRAVHLVSTGGWPMTLGAQCTRVH